MSNLIKNMIMASLGIVSITKKNAEKLAKDLIKEGKLSETQEARFIKDLMTKSKKVSSNFNKKIEILVEKSLKRLNVATRKDLDDIKQKLNVLVRKKD